MRNATHSREGESSHGGESSVASQETDDYVTSHLSDTERRSLFSDSDSESETEGPPSKKPKLDLGEETLSYIRSAMDKPLKNDKRKAHIAKHSLPSVEPAFPPKLDEAITCLIPKAARSIDRFLSKLQQFCMDSLGPILFLNEKLSEIEPQIDLETIRSAAKTSLTLIANASAHFTVERQKCIMKHLNKDLKPLAEEQYPSRGPSLFGEGFAAKAKATADGIKALKGAQKSFSAAAAQSPWAAASSGVSQAFRLNHTEVFRRLGPPANQRPPNGPRKTSTKISNPRINNNLAASSTKTTIRPTSKDSCPERPATPTSNYGVYIGRKNHPSQGSMAEVDIRPMGLRSHLRLQDRANSPPLPDIPITHSGERRTCHSNLQRVDQSIGEGSSAESSATSRARLCVMSVSSTKERWTKLMRPVINLRPFNHFVAFHHFKTEGIQVVKDMLQPNDWMVRIDLKDAYFSIPVHQEYQKYLRFIWGRKMYQFTCLPFGLSSAPRVFTKILRPIVGFFRSKGIRCVIYLDDLLLLAQMKETVKEHAVTVLTILKALRFLINYMKSSLVPQQEVTFLGFEIRSKHMELKLPQDKLVTIQKEVSNMLKQKLVSARSQAHLIGKMSAALLAVRPASFHYCNLQQLKPTALRKRSYDASIHLTQSARKDLTWWLESLPWNG